MPGVKPPGRGDIREQVKQRYAEAVDVRSFVCTGPVQHALLRRSVSRCSNGPGCAGFHSIHPLYGAEIDEVYLPLRRQHDVCRLHIPVDHPVPMHIPQNVGQDNAPLRYQLLILRPF